MLAMALRAPHVDKGLPYIHYYDEPFVASNALNILKTGDLNPHWYSYGSLPIYLNALVDVFHYAHLMGQPPGDHPYMTNLHEIQTNRDTGYLWTISHPSFLAWNRLLTCVFGAGTVVFVYLLAYEIFRNRWTALVPAGTLAFVPIHIEFSALAGVDVPSGFFYVGCVYFSLVFAQSGRTWALVWTLLFVAFATATKYNAALCGVMPALAMLWRQLGAEVKPRPYHWIMLVLIPPVAFLAVMPYALFDLQSFLHAAGYEVRHYKVMGHGMHTSEPGWPQMEFQWAEFRKNLGIVPLSIAIAGLIGIVFRRWLAFTMVLPIIGMMAMSQMTANFHRNFLLFYPFIALSFLAGFYVVLRLIEALLPKSKRTRGKPIAAGMVWGIATALVGVMAVNAVRGAVAVANHVETRSRAIEAVNAMDGIRGVMVAEELGIHESDLRRLRVPRMVAPLASIVDSPPLMPGVVCLLPSGLRMAGGDPRLLDQLGKTYPAKLDQFRIEERIEGENLSLDLYSVDPGVLVCAVPVPEVDAPAILPRFADASPIPEDPIVYDEQRWQFAVPVGESLDVSLFDVVPERHILSLQWTGGYDFGLGTKLEVALEDMATGERVGVTVSEPQENAYLDGTTLEHVLLSFTPRAAGRVAAVLSVRSNAPRGPDVKPWSVYVKNLEVRQLHR